MAEDLEPRLWWQKLDAIVERQAALDLNLRQDLSFLRQAVAIMQQAILNLEAQLDLNKEMRSKAVEQIMEGVSRDAAAGEQ